MLYLFASNLCGGKESHGIGFDNRRLVPSAHSLLTPREEQCNGRSLEYIMQSYVWQPLKTFPPSYSASAQGDHLFYEPSWGPYGFIKSGIFQGIKHAIAQNSPLPWHIHIPYTWQPSPFLGQWIYKPVIVLFKCVFNIFFFCSWEDTHICKQECIGPLFWNNISYDTMSIPIRTIQCQVPRVNLRRLRLHHRMVPDPLTWDCSRFKILREATKLIIWSGGICLNIQSTNQRIPSHITVHLLGCFQWCIYPI